MEERLKITVTDRHGSKQFLIVGHGVNLRTALLENGFSPYVGAFKNFNCKGMGVCGTCKVFVLEHGEFWERRSCQIQCFQDLEIRLK